MAVPGAVQLHFDHRIAQRAAQHKTDREIVPEAVQENANREMVHEAVQQNSDREMVLGTVTTEEFATIDSGNTPAECARDAAFSGELLVSLLRLHSASRPPAS